MSHRLLWQNHFQAGLYFNKVRALGRKTARDSGLDLVGLGHSFVLHTEPFRDAEGDFQMNRLEAEAEYLLASREQEGRDQGYLALSKAMENNSQSIIAIESVRAQIEISKHLGNSNNTMIIPTEVAGLIGAASAAISSIKSLTK